MKREEAVSLHLLMFVSSDSNAETVQLPHKKATHSEKLY